MSTVPPENGSHEQALSELPEDGRPRAQPLPAATLAAIGVVFGDIGTSPLYSMQTAFALSGGAIAPNRQDIYGIISMVVWAILIIVTLKYVVLAMRADHDGEGGILSLVSLLGSKLPPGRLSAAVLGLGVVGAALFYGDALITPAISVMSAVEGLSVVDSSAGRLVVPIALGILSALFAIQRFGTGGIGRAFGPIMVVWFFVIGLMGVPHILAHPAILGALWPGYALAFAIRDPGLAFLALGAVVLTITGAEALYADMGNFGHRPIRLGWFALVLPALLLNYLGQGALLLTRPESIRNPFFMMVPGEILPMLVALATGATVIASQAVISGTFSVTRQAMRLQLLPRMTIRNTSRHTEGQIFIPSINTLLYLGIAVLVVSFGSSRALADAYGLAVTGTLALTTVLLLVLIGRIWRWPVWLVTLIAVVIGGPELLLLAANLLKIPTGGWLPLLVASIVILVMTTWRRGSKLVVQRRSELEGPMGEFADYLKHRLDDGKVQRVPGLAVFLHSNPQTAPLAMQKNVRFNKVLHTQNVILSVQPLPVPHIHHRDRIVVRDHGYAELGIEHIQVRVGYMDSQDVPRMLLLARGRLRNFEPDPGRARYFLSVLTLQLDSREHDPPDGRMLRLHKHLFIWLSHNMAARIDVFHLPGDRTIVMGGNLAI